jgi:hypothetical protein
MGKPSLTLIVPNRGFVTLRLGLSRLLSLSSPICPHSLRSSLVFPWSTPFVFLPLIVVMVSPRWQPLHRRTRQSVPQP